MIPIIPAVSIASSVFRSSAAGPNAAAAAAVLPDALAGNLAAVQAFRNRATLQTTSSAAPWVAGLSTIDPGLIQAAQEAVAKGLIPAAWWNLPPEAVVGLVRQYSNVRAQVGPGIVTATPGASTGLSSIGNALNQLFGPTAASAGAAAGASGAQQYKGVIIVGGIVALLLVAVLIFRRRG